MRTLSMMIMSKKKTTERKRKNQSYEKRITKLQTKATIETNRLDRAFVDYCVHSMFKSIEPKTMQQSKWINMRAIKLNSREKEKVR